MTSTTDRIVTPPAVTEWETRGLIRALLEAARSGDLTARQASLIGFAAGIGLTENKVTDGITFLDQADHPDEQLDAEEHDLGPIRGNREQALTDIHGAAQGDLDDLVADLALFARTDVSVPVSVLAVVRVIAGDQP